MKNKNQSFHILPVEQSLALRSAVSEISSENSKDSISLESPTNSSAHCLHETYMELVKLIEMQRNDTDKQSYDEQIDTCVKTLGLQFQAFLQQYDESSSNHDSEKQEDAKSIMKSKEKYKKLYQEKSHELSKALSFQRDSFEALARIKVEFEEYRNKMNAESVKGIFGIQFGISNAFNDVEKKIKKTYSMVDAKIIALNSRISRVCCHVKPDMLNSKHNVKNNTISVQELADMYESNEDHSVMHTPRVNLQSPAKLSVSAANTIARARTYNTEHSVIVNPGYITTEQATIIDLQSKLKASRESLLNAKNENRLLSSKSNTMIHEVEEWKKHATKLEKELNDCKEKHDLNIQQLKSAIDKEKSNNNDLRSILTLLKDDTSKLMASAQEYQETIITLKSTLKKLLVEKEDLTNRKQDLEENLRSREEEISALYYQNNLRAIKINELTEKLAEDDKDFKLPIGDALVPSSGCKNGDQSNLLQYLTVASKASEQYMLVANSLLVPPQAESDGDLISKYRLINLEASNNLALQDYFEEICDVLMAYKKESAVLWKLISSCKANTLI